MVPCLTDCPSTNSLAMNISVVLSIAYLYPSSSCFMESSESSNNLPLEPPRMQTLEKDQASHHWILLQTSNPLMLFLLDLGFILFN